MSAENVINKDELIERLDNDIDLFKELAVLFIEDSKKLLTRIENSIKEENAENLRKSAHTIKGSVSNFSAKKAYDAAYNLEIIGTNNELDKAEEAFIILKNEIANTITAMEEMMKKDKF